MPLDLTQRLLDVRRIYHEHDIDRFPRATANGCAMGVLLLLRPTPHGIRQPHHRPRQHRGGSRLPRTPRRAPGREAEPNQCDPVDWVYDLGEDLLWRPDFQQAKLSQSGQANVRYRTGGKVRWVQQHTDLLPAKLPECRVRCAF